VTNLITSWEKNKEVLLQNIDEVIDRGNIDKETLVVMKEIISAAKMKKRTMTEYFEDSQEG
jgi:hypothetical protein